MDDLMNLQKFEDSETIENICSRYILNIDMIRDVLVSEMKGFNNKEIAERLGVHRITVQRYAAAFRKMHQEEFEQLYKYFLEMRKDETTN